MKERVDIFLEKYRERMPDYLADIEAIARANNVPVISRVTGDLLRFILRSERSERRSGFPRCL